MPLPPWPVSHRGREEGGRGLDRIGGWTHTAPPLSLLPRPTHPPTHPGRGVAPPSLAHTAISILPPMSLHIPTYPPTHPPHRKEATPPQVFTIGQ